MSGLEVSICKKLGTFELEVSFQTENEILAILGASGCGKSMTLKCIAGIETPDSGRIILNGRVLFDAEKRINVAPQKRNIGYMFQDYALFPNMTVLANIMIALRKCSRQEREQKAMELIRKFRLEGLEKQLPGQLSGGQKQRTAMARMLASEPELLLMDEPFSALDSHLKWELEQEMKELLNQLGKTTLFVSHDRDEVCRICDRVTCISGGRTEEPVGVREFFEDPKTFAAARLSGCKNISAARRIDKRHLFAEDWNKELTLEKEIPEDIAFVGIRAHSFEPADTEGESAGPGNVFRTAEYRIMEELFEWDILFRQENAVEWILWRVSKKQWNPEKMPKYLTVGEKDILLLK